MVALAKHWLYLLPRLKLSLLAKRTFLLFLCILLVVSCKKEEVKLSFSEVQITTKNNDLVEVFIPKAEGNQLVSETINTEIENIVATFLSIGEPPDINDKTLSISEKIEAFNQEYKNFVKDFPDITQQWGAQIDGEVIFQSNGIISIAITSYINTGGAHGNTNITFLNFDAQTGNQIPNENLFKNIEAFKPVAKSYFDKAVTDTSVLFEPESFQLPANIAFSDEGLILLYNTYEIAPYATGIIEFTIPFEVVNQYLVFNSL